MSNDINPVKFGEMVADVAALKKDMKEVRDDMKAVRSTLDQAKGGWKVLVMQYGLVAAVTTILIKLIDKFTGGN